MVGHTRSAHVTTVEKPARAAPVRGFSVRKRVTCLQIIEKSVESSRSSPETGAHDSIPAPYAGAMRRLEWSHAGISRCEPDGCEGHMAEPADLFAADSGAGGAASGTGMRLTGGAASGDV
ncbi:MAG: hypothetical protein EBT18_10715, partial [Gammaproteobacteria bacterium]|nr:hypothetical protein [Gammaproteobacteria bacterium]